VSLGRAIETHTIGTTKLASNTQEISRRRDSGR